MNESGAEPVEYNVIVRPDPVEEKTAGGLYLPDDHRDREKHATTRGMIVAMSAMAYSRTPSGDEWTGAKPQPGSRVMFGKYSGRTFDGVDGVQYRVMKDEDVIAIIDRE